MALLALCTATFDGRAHPAEVVEVREAAAGRPRGYYVHYADFNKRLDEWVAADRLQPLPPGGLGAPGAEAAGTGRAAPLADPKTPGSGDRKLTRSFKRRYDEIHHVEKPVAELPAIDQQLEKAHEERTKVKNIQLVELGRYEMDTWYFSPYPGEYAHCHKVFLCEYCLKYMQHKESLIRHHAACDRRKPPGKEIYRASRPPSPKHALPISAFEVDGKEHKLYCQNLALLSKLFLDHKTCFFDTEPFKFYVVTERDERGHHLVGYFSKEKNSLEGYNLACILTLPSYQRKGYGGFLIALSYELSRREGKVGTPERPLSDLGQVSYRSFWLRQTLGALHRHRGQLSVKELSEMTHIRAEDIVTTLQSINLIKYWKGQHIINTTPRVVEEHLRSLSNHRQLEILQECIRWEPAVEPGAAGAALKRKASAGTPRTR